MKPMLRNDKIKINLYDWFIDWGLTALSAQIRLYRALKI